jgi:hypothetical protein
MDESDAFRF